MQQDVRTLLAVFGGVGVVAVACATTSTWREIGTVRDDERRIDYRLRVECACEWLVSSPDGTVEGNGRTTVQLPDDPFVCASVTKTEEDNRLLRARVVPDGEWAETDVRNETITVCARGNAPLPLPDPER